MEPKKKTLQRPICQAPYSRTDNLLRHLKTFHSENIAIRMQTKKVKKSKSCFSNKCGKGTWVDVHPIAFVSDTGPIKFESEGKQQEFLNLAHMLLYVTVQLVKSNESEVDGGG